MAGMSAHDPALPPGAQPELAGRLLVATPELGEGPFERSVVLLLDHDENGALGVVINRPTEVDVSEVLPSWQPLASAPGVLFQGGPVALDSALGLALVPSGADDEEEPLGWRRVVGRLGLVDLDTPPELLAAELTDLRIFAGYAGWAGGQLEDELDEGAWFVVPASADGAFADAFTTEPDRLWRDVLRRQGGDLAMVSTYLADPSLN
jgi:putative transcriptional regulator